MADRNQTAYWDDFFRRIDAGAPDLDWGGCWTEPFVPLLRAAAARDLLELGCGTGHDAARMAAIGLRVVAVDFSAEAIARARRIYGSVVDFRVADISTGLPFAPASFDAVMANVSLHMFPDTLTRAIFDDVGSVVRPNGLFLLHVNALDDRPLRERARPIVRELEPNYVLEQAGQTVRYFSQSYLLDLLAGWEIVSLTHRELLRTHANASFQKRVWCAVARKAPAVTAAGATRSSRRSLPPECSCSPAE